MDSDFRRLCFNRPRSKQVYLQHARFGIDFFFSFFTFTERLETRNGIKQRNNEGHCLPLRKENIISSLQNVQ